MSAATTAELAQPAAEAIAAGKCSSEDCGRPAVWAVRFHGQAGHAHDCNPHTALLREHCDVAEVLPIANCPWPHGPIWTSQPAALML